MGALRGFHIATAGTFREGEQERLPALRCPLNDPATADIWYVLVPNMVKQEGTPRP